MKLFTISSLAILACALAAATAGTAADGPPRNDNRANAIPLQGLPVTVSGTTVGATEESQDPRPACGRVKATVWYRISGASPGRLVLRFTASGQLDAIVSVYRVVRSRLVPLGCQPTDDRGRGDLSLTAAAGESYLIMVGREPASEDGSFRFTLFRQEPSSRPPGAPLPRRGVSSSVDALSDFDDAWSLPMRAGVAYRMNLSPARGRCVTLSLFKPHTRSFAGAPPIHVVRCGGYFTYTPGIGGADGTPCS